MNLDSTFLPRRKTESVITERIFDEVVIYDRDGDSAHCLDATAAAVWEQCDGTRSISEIADGIPGEPAGSVRLVELALHQLDRARLLATPLPSDIGEGLTRRKVIREMSRWGVVAAVPFVLTREAPGQVFCDGVSCLPGERCEGGICVPDSSTQGVQGAKP